MSYNNCMMNEIVKEEIEWHPADNGHGKMRVGEELCYIKNWHSFDDYGQTIETVTIRSPKGQDDTIYSLDEGLTWQTEL